jgi:CRP-like cAMP-binding protein
MKNNQTSGGLDFFRQVPLFYNLTDDQIHKLMDLMEIREITEGETLMREGAHDETLFILIRGKVEISKSLVLPFLETPDSLQEKSLITLTEKQFPFFGEMALFDAKPERSATVTVLSEGTAAILHKKELIAALDSDPAMGTIVYKNIATELVNRLKKANKDILKLTTAFSLALEG